MRAWISKKGVNIGTEFQTISPEYKRVNSIFKFAHKCAVAWNSEVKIEVHYNWDTRYDDEKGEVWYTN
jgi:hypothetical protein